MSLRNENFLQNVTEIGKAVCFSCYFLLRVYVMCCVMWCRAQRSASVPKTNCFVVTLNLSCSSASLTDVANCTRSSWNSHQRTARRGWRYLTVFGCLVHLMLILPAKLISVLWLCCMSIWPLSKTHNRTLPEFTFGNDAVLPQITPDIVDISWAAAAVETISNSVMNTGKSMPDKLSTVIKPVQLCSSPIMCYVYIKYLIN